MKKNISLIMAVVFMLLLMPLYAAAEQVSVKIPKWTGSNLSYNPAEVSEDWVKLKLITDEEKVFEGFACAYLSMEGYKGSTWSMLKQQISGMEKGEKYRLQAAINSSNCTGEHQFRFGSGSAGNIVNCAELKEMGQMTPGVWCKISYDFSYNWGGTIDFSFMNWKNGEVYIDNISLRKIEYDDEGNEIGLGDELIINGDFESDLDFTPCGEVSDIKVTNMDEKALISWTNPTDADFKSVLVYRDIGGVYAFVSEVSGTSIEISGLQNNISAVFVLRTSDEWDNLSDGVIAEAVPIADSFKYTVPVFYKGGNKIKNISAGNIKASVGFKNNRMAEDTSAEIILVLLKDGAAVDMKSAYSIIPLCDENEEYTYLEAETEVPYGSGYSIRLLIWDSITGMDVLTDIYELN